MPAPLFIDHMLADKNVQAQIMARCQALCVADNPARIADDLGLLDLPDGTRTRVWMLHAADTVLLDDHDQVALITRLNNPGRGKLALPGGLLDATENGPELSLTAALRETIEETGISSNRLAEARITQLGHRRTVRPFDIRQAWNNLPGTPVCQGELFTVSTLGFCARLAGDLRDIPFRAGDDASSIEILYAHAVLPENLAVPDHLELIHAALGM